MDEYGQHLRGVIGPYNEGFPLSLACEGEGGKYYIIIVDIFFVMKYNSFKNFKLAMTFPECF